jgi:glycosyltransferase involved in cell wall biosynthesis
MAASSRPRLLAISHEYTLTGAPVCLLHALRRLSGDFDILVASHTDGPLRRHFIESGFHTIVVPNLNRDANYAASLLLSYDAVFANTVIAFPAIHAAHHMKKPSFWYLHEALIVNSYIQMFGQPLVDAFSLASRLLVPCEFSRKLYAPVRQDSAIVRYSIEPMEQIPTEPGAGQTRPLKVLMLGTVIHRKGHDTAVIAMRELRDVNVELTMVGSHPEPQFAAHVQQLAAGMPNIRFAPAVDWSQSLATLAQHDVLIVPSRDEVTPMVILEAMAIGRPVIASSCGGVPEMIEHGVSGLIHRAENHTELAAAIRSLATDESRRASITREAYARVRDLYSQEQQREALLGVIRPHLTTQS